MSASTSTQSASAAADSRLATWRVRALCKRLDQHSTNPAGDDQHLHSLYVAAGAEGQRQLAHYRELLRKGVANVVVEFGVYKETEFGAASENGAKGLALLLELLETVPAAEIERNGVALFAAIYDKAYVTMPPVRQVVRPALPLSVSLYQSDFRFQTKPLLEQLSRGTRLAVVLVASDGGVVASVLRSDSAPEVHERLAVALPIGRVGDVRFADHRAQMVRTYETKLAETARAVLAPLAVDKLVVAATPEFAERWRAGAPLDAALRAKLVKFVPIDEDPEGIPVRRVLEHLDDVCPEHRFAAETAVLARLRAGRNDKAAVVVGVDDVMRRLKADRVDTLVLYENLRTKAFTIADPDGNERTAYAEAQEDLGDGLVVVAEENLVDKLLIDTPPNVKVELISYTRDGVQFVNNDGGIAALLRT